MREAVIKANRKNSSGDSTHTQSKKKDYPSKYNNNLVERWDSECSDAIANRLTNLKKFLKSGLYTDFIEYKNARAIVTRTIRIKKKNNFIEFISSINKFTSLSYVWKKMKVLKRSFQKIAWNKWQNNDRRTTIMKTIAEISPDTYSTLIPISTHITI